MVQNNGAQQLASEATVYIMLEDVNDEIPLFTEREQETVLEGEPIGTKVTQVNAIDKDGTFPNNQVFNNIVLQNTWLNVLYYYRSLSRSEPNSTLYYWFWNTMNIYLCTICCVENKYPICYQNQDGFVAWLLVDLRNFPLKTFPFWNNETYLYCICKCLCFYLNMSIIVEYYRYYIIQLRLVLELFFEILNLRTIIEFTMRRYVLNYYDIWINQIKS